LFCSYGAADPDGTVLTDAASDAAASDAAASDAASSDAVLAPDADGGADACVDNPAQSDFSTNAGWTARGNALIDPANGLGMLTPNAPNMAGALWWSQRVHLQDFELSFSLRVQGGGSSSEGLAFAWTEALSVPALGNAGPALGACGLPSGWAVLFSMVPQGNPSTTPIRVVETTSCTGSITPAQSTADGSWHAVLLVVKSGLLGVSIDGVQKISGAAVPSAKVGGVDGFWGFTGATSGLGEAHEVRNVVMTLTDPCPR
jgi:hypothetical protein